MGGKKLGKNDEKNAKLRDKKGRSWDVKLVTSSGDIRPHFKDGWEKFCKECDLQPLPREFAEKNGLSKRWCEMELIDEKGHPWKMLLRHYRKGNGSPYIGSWKAFRKANGLNTGDAVIFQLIHSGERPVIKFYIIFFIRII
uniref:TF-B3 domain-containing protein n=1 Tax=Chenopodium quinoa TaxID=63459 RepID=A0A803KTI1_CHEQI